MTSSESVTEAGIERRSPRPVDYSVVMPVYCNAGLLVATMESLKSEVIARHPELTCEVIFVDDGSLDRSLDELLGIYNDHPELVKIIQLTRNFGQPNARLAGLSYASGRCVISRSADGQDPCSLINDMLHAHFEEGHEVVIATRVAREDSRYRAVTSRMFYGLMRRMVFKEMPPGGFDYVLLGRRALDTILANQDAQPFFQGQILWTGFRPKMIEYRRLKRKIGSSRWTFGRKLTLLIDATLNYSFLPIRAISLCGIACALFGFLFGASVIVRRLMLGTEVQGWATLAVLVSLIGGMQMLMLGIIGEYLWRTMAEARGRAGYVIDKIYDSETDMPRNAGAAGG